MTIYRTALKNKHTQRIVAHLLIKPLECLHRTELSVFLSLKVWASGWDKDSLKGRESPHTVCAAVNAV